MEYRRRRVITMFLLAGIIIIALVIYAAWQLAQSSHSPQGNGEALAALEALPVKGRAPKTGYARSQFGAGWATTDGCDTRNIILARDLKQAVVSGNCKVASGQLDDPYTGKRITFQRGSGTSTAVQIDHVVALSNAWQTGAQQLSSEQRQQLANDPLELTGG